MGHYSTRPRATLGARRALWRNALYVLTALLTVGPAAAQTGAAQVDLVIDADAIRVRLDGARYTVRFTGVDTPETTHPTRGVEPDGPEVMTSSQADQDAARQDREPSPQAFNRETASDPQRDSGSSR